MAYDPHLANRVREQLALEDACTEQAMFGALAFLLGGNMAAGVSGDELMVRVGKDAADAALDEPHTRPFDMTGRPMKAWVLVSPEGVRSDEQLRAWLARGVAHARSLPPKS
jgi:TfoX/Sxy family transcriptional regulator of competence genes